MDTNKPDINSLMEKLLAMQDSLLQAQEKNLTLAAQIRDLERQIRDVEELRIEHDNQSQLLADKTRENKHLHQELSRMSGMMNIRIQENEEMKTNIAELQHQLKNSQADRDLLAIMLTDAENAVRDESRSSSPNNRVSKENPKDWKNILKGK
ncbi:MAG: hypothetical protein K2W82_05000 [Candidatus Obscuribacterales bacterium]|nr:hypothetical protein [Candidatus Obscuribacterales bacterium]